MPLVMWQMGKKVSLKSVATLQTKEMYGNVRLLKTYENKLYVT